MNLPDAPQPDRKLMLWGLLCFLIGTAGVAVAIMGTVPVSDGVSLQSPDGMNATLTGATEAQLENPFPTSGTVEWTTEAGNISFFSSGAAAATVHKDEITGTFTRITAIDADPNTITINPGDKSSVVVGQEITTFAWRSGITADDGTHDFEYSASGPGRATVQGVAASTRLAAVDASSGTVLDTATSSGGGAVTFNSLSSGTHNVEIQTFTPAAPTISNPSPTGGTISPPTEVSVDVSDGDFPRGDSATVTIDVDGSQVHTQTISSNQTVTASVPQSARTGGTHSWSVQASDSYGESTSASYSYTVPSNLTIFNETSPSQVVNNVNVTLQFYRGDTVFTRNTSDGSINLTGLPVSNDMIVLASADGYFTRRTYIESIYDQQSIYLLNRNITTASVVFNLDDRTGNFPAGDTVLRIQRPLTKDFDGDGNETTQWRTIAGDYFGASGSFPAELETETRYRLIVENRDGDVRSLGSYTVTGDAVETLPIGQVSFSETASGNAALQGTLVDYENSRYVRVLFRDLDGATSSLEYRIVRADNESKVLQSNVTINGPLESYVATVAVPSSAPDDVGYKIEWTATRTDAEDAGGVVYVGDVPAFLRGLGLGSTVAAYIAFVALAALVGLVVIYDDRLAAITGVVGATFLSMGGIVSIPPLALGVAGTIALIYTVARVR